MSDYQHIFDYGNGVVVPLDIIIDAFRRENFPDAEDQR